MTDKNRVVVKLLGQEYKLISDEPREYMQRVSNYVDDKMVEIAEGNKKLSTAMIAVLTSLNIADEYFKLLESSEELEKRISNPGYDFEITQKRLSVMNEELNSRNKDYEKMVTDFESLLENTSVYEEEMTSLREKMNVLSYELNNKEEMLKKSNDTIKELRQKIDEKDQRYQQHQENISMFIDEVGID